MGLLQNGYRHNLTGRIVGSTNIDGWRPQVGVYQGHRTAAMRNLLTGTTDSRASVPVGNLPPSAWIMAAKSGGMSMRGTGSGTIASSLIASRPMSIDLTGAGDLAAIGALAVAMFSAMSGEGSLSATINGLLNMSADLDGSGDLSASMEGIASLAVDLLGQGDLDATIAAYGNMEIDLVVTGTGLTTGNVGDAVWTYLIGSSEAQDLLAAAGAAGDPLLGSVEGGLTLRDVQRIMLAALAGTSERVGSTITFTSPVDGTTVRISGSFDAENNRTGVVIDGT